MKWFTKVFHVFKNNMYIQISTPRIETCYNNLFKGVNY